MKYGTYFQAHLWTCMTCGFCYEGGQPKMECPVCESYKTNFIDIPQHLEAQVREEFPDVPHNHHDARDRRVELMNEHDVRNKHRARGRILPAASGNNIDPSSDDI